MFTVPTLTRFTSADSMSRHLSALRQAERAERAQASTRIFRKLSPKTLSCAI